MGAAFRLRRIDASRLAPLRRYTNAAASDQRERLSQFRAEAQTSSGAVAAANRVSRRCGRGVNASQTASKIKPKSHPNFPKIPATKIERFLIQKRCTNIAPNSPPNPKKKNLPPAE